MLAKGTVAKATPPPTSSNLPIPLASGSALRKLNASQSSDSSPSKAVSERKRKKTNACEISYEESTEVKGRVVNVGGQLMHVPVSGMRNTIKKMMIEYGVQCQNAMKTGKREDLSKILQTKLNEQKREAEEKTRAKATNPGKPAEIAVPTPPVGNECNNIYNGSGKNNSN